MSGDAQPPQNFLIQKWSVSMVTAATVILEASKKCDYIRAGLSMRLCPLSVFLSEKTVDSRRGNRARTVPEAVVGWSTKQDCQGSKRELLDNPPAMQCHASMFCSCKTKGQVHQTAATTVNLVFSFLSVFGWIFFFLLVPLVAPQTRHYLNTPHEQLRNT